MDVSLNCAVCGQDVYIESVESPMHCQGFIDSWAMAHRHSELELKMYQDAEIAVRQYQHDHLFSEGIGDDD